MADHPPAALRRSGAPRAELFYDGELAALARRLFAADDRSYRLLPGAVPLAV